MTYDDLEFHRYSLGMRAKATFENGYTASVIDCDHGSEEGLYEVAVMRNGRLDYSTPVTDEVVDELTEADVTRYLAEIAALPDPDRRIMQ